MKQTLILIIIGAAVIGTAYWVMTRNSTPAPAVTIDEPIIEPITGDYVGLTEGEAEVLAIQNNVPFRVVVLDGEPQMVTEDFRPGRINATVEAGVVTSYEVEGLGMEDEGGMSVATHEGIIGMTVAEAEAYAAENNVMFRIGFRDGEPLAVTMDYRIGRITAQVENDIVTGYTVE